MKKEVSLRKFVEERYQLLTIIGVFVALTTYFSSSVFKLDPMFSFTTKIMLLLLVLELFIDSYKRFIIHNDEENPSIALAIFLICFLWLITGINIQLISTDYEIIKTYLTPFVMLIYLIIGITVINNCGIIKKCNKKYKWFEKLMCNSSFRKTILYLILVIPIILVIIFIKLIKYIGVSIKL